MACRLDDAKPLSEPMQENCELNHPRWNINRNSNIFIQENALEKVVCEMASICLGLNVLRHYYKVLQVDQMFITNRITEIMLVMLFCFNSFC